MHTHQRRERGVLYLVVCLCWAMLHPAPVAAEEEVANSIGIKLRLLQAGRFEQGQGDLSPGFGKDHSEFNTDNDERPVHPVVLTSPFYLATTEVTRAQFRQFVEATGYKTSAEKNPRGAVGWDPTPPADNPRFLSTFRDDGDFAWRQPGFEQSDDHPVTCVSFADAKAFCRWLSDKEAVTYRLPTEAEWEYAARAGTTTYFSFGDAYRGRIHRFANVGNVELEKAFPDRVRRQWLVDVARDPADQHIFTAPVGGYEPNPWGLLDMYGNVWEWCEDRYLDTAYTPYKRSGYQQIRKRAIDPLNSEKWSDKGDWRVIRGGSWFNSPIQCRSGVRGYFEADDAACYVGFRVARDAPEEMVAAARRKFEQSEEARAAIIQMIQPQRVQERRDGRLTLLLRHGDLDAEFLTALANLDEPIDVHLNCEGSLTREDLAALTRPPQLTGLLLSRIGSDLADDDFAVLADHSELELLQVTGAPKLSDGLLRHLRTHDRLELLELDAGEITDQGLELLPALEKLSTLRLRGTVSRGLVLEHFRRSPLRVFSCDHLTDEGAHLLAGYTQLRELALAGSPLTGRGLEAISRLPWVNRLALHGCQSLSDEDLAVLGNLYELQSLRLEQTAAGDAAVSGIGRLNNLRELNLGSEQLSDAGVRRLCEVVSLDNLALTEDAVNVTDAGLADLWRLANLRSLSIAAPQVTGSGLATLSELSKFDGLQLTGAGISDAALENAAQSDSLQRLFVGSWQTGGPANLTDAGVLHLAGSRSLKQFDLIRRQTQVTDQGLERLRQRRPQLNVNPR